MDTYIMSYGLTLLALIIVMGSQSFVNSSYKKYSKVKNSRGITGKEAARIILDKNGLKNVEVIETTGFLSDHYDPRDKVVRLSKSNYNTESIASVSIACHECGHAIQDKDGYIFLRLRSKIIPIVNISSKLGYAAIMLGCIFSLIDLIWLGILAEVVILVFQLITLPVEFDASKKGLKELKSTIMLSEDETRKGKTVLTAAALTYVASVASTLIEILRLIIIFTRRDD